MPEQGGEAPAEQDEGLKDASGDNTIRGACVRFAREKGIPGYEGGSDLEPASLF